MGYIIEKGVTLLVMVSTIIAGRTQSPSPAIANALQTVVNNSLPTNFSNPGVVMGITVPGEWSWYGAAGDAIAGITAGQPQTTATPTTRFRVGSISKMMVATAVL